MPRSPFRRHAMPRHAILIQCDEVCASNFSPSIPLDATISNGNASGSLSSPATIYSCRLHAVVAINMRCIQKDHNHRDDNESVSTTVETFQGIASSPILLEDLRVIAIAFTRRIQIGDESYSIDSCFGFTPSEIVATARGDQESFLN
jgi:hypothetical protein